MQTGWLKISAAIAAGATVAVGVITLLGWHLGERRLIEFVDGWAGTTYETGACLVLAGISLLWLVANRVSHSLLFVGLAGAIVITALVRHAFAVDLPVLHLAAAGEEMPPLRSMRGLTASGIGALLLAMALLAAFRHRARIGVAAMLASIVVAFALMIVVDLQFSLPYPLAERSGFSLATALGLMLLGAGVLAQSVLSQRTIEANIETPRWVPLALAVGVFSSAFVLWLSVAGNVQRGNPIAWADAGRLTLLIGLILAVLVGLTAHLAQLAAMKARRMGELNRQLREEIRQRIDAEHDVRRRSRELEDFFDSAAVGLHIVDSQGIIRRVNQAELDLLKYSSQELIGQHVGVVHASVAVAEDILARLHRGEELRDFEAELRCKDGTRRHMLLDSNVLWENGRFVHTRCFVRDVTERTRRDRAMRRLVECAQLSGTQFFQAMVQALSDLLGVRHAVLAQIVDDGRRAQILAMSSDGTICNEGVIYELDGTPCEQAIRRRTCLFNGGVVQQFPRDAMLAQLRVESYLGTPLRASTGDPIGIFAVLHDRPIEPEVKPATMLELFADRVAAELERQLAERALRSSQEQLSAMFNQVAVGIVRCGLDGRIDFVNQRFSEIVGRSGPQLIGASMMDVAHPEDRETLRQDLQRLDRGSSGLINELRFVRPDGTHVWVSNSLSVVTDENGQPSFAVAVASDISLRKQAEMALQLLSGTSGLVSASIDFEQALTKVARLAVPEFADWCAVHVAEDDGLVRQTTVALEPGNSQVCLELRRAYRLESDDGREVAAVLRSGQGQVHDIVSEEWLASVAGPDQRVLLGDRALRSAMTVPLVARGRTIGAMVFLAIESGRRFDQRDLLLAQELARRCALAVDNARLYRDLSNRVNELQTLLDVLPVGICIATDAQCRTMTMNAATARLLGVESAVNPSMGASHAAQLPFKVFRNGEEVPANQLAMQQAAATGQTLRGFDYEVRRSDGTVAHLQVDAAPLVDDSGDVRGSVGVMVDVTERTKAERRLAAEHAVARILAESASLDEAAPRLLEAVCTGLGFYVGGLWTPHASNGFLVCTQMWSRSAVQLDAFVRRSGEVTFEPGRGLPGRVWSTGAPVWIDDVVSDTNFPRAPYAQKAGLHSAVAFPIKCGEDFVGVMEFFAPHIGRPDRALIEMMAAVGSDIGQFVQRARMELALRESEQRFRSMADAAPVLIWLAAPDQTCTYVNQRWREFTGADFKACHGRPHWHDRVHPSDAEACTQAFHQAFESRGPLSMEYRLRHHSGAYRWVLESAVPRLSVDGELLGYIGSCVDISAIKQAEMGLRARARQQRTIARIGQRALVDSDLATLLQETSANLARALRVPATAVFELLPGGRTFTLRGGSGWDEDAIGRVSINAADLGFTSAQDIGDRSLVVQNWNEQADLPWPEPLRARGFVSAALIPIIAGTQRFGLLGALSPRPRDFSRGDVHFLQAAANILATAITRHRAGEELDRYRRHLETLVAERTAALETSHEHLRMAERLAALGTLSTGLGHDIGNLVLPVLCRLDFLAAQRLPASVNTALEAIRDSVVRLRQLANGLRLFTLDPSDTQGSSGVTHLHEWWPQAGPLLAKALRREVELQCELPHDLPPVAIAAHQLTQAVLNLVTNAGEAISGRGLVRVWAKADADRRLISVGVTDNGQGMSEEVRRHALEPFFTTKKRSLSTGLGLSLVHAVIQAVGGTMNVHSTSGRGTTIVLQLPVAARQTANNRDETSPSLARIDLADPRVASLAGALLRSTGLELAQEPAIAGNGDPAHRAKAPGENVLIWIVDPASATLETVQMFLRSRPGRRVIAIGQADPPWNESGVIVVDGSYRAMRQALQQAAGHEHTSAANDGASQSTPNGDLEVRTIRRQGGSPPDRRSADGAPQEPAPASHGNRDHPPQSAAMHAVDSTEHSP